MTVTIEVKPQLAHRWKAIAEREGRALEAIALQAAEAGTGTLESDGMTREYSRRNPLALVRSRDAAAPLSTRTTNAADDLEAMRAERTDCH